MQSNRFWQGVRRVYARYDRLMEKQGFYVVLGVCVLMIVLSALYTFSWRDQWQDDSADALMQAVDAGGAQQSQTLAEALVESSHASQPIVVPTQAPFTFHQPLDGYVIRAFDVTRPQYFAHGRVWQVHAGVDLAADYGELVTACESGTVTHVYADNALGLCVRVAHAGGYESLYAGLSDAGYVQPGDPVRRGQTIGHAGNGVLIEGDAQPHLHLEVWKNGHPVDPMSVFLGLDG